MEATRRLLPARASSATSGKACHSIFLYCRTPVNREFLCLDRAFLGKKAL